MKTHHGTESEFELTTIQCLEALKYQHVFGMDIERPRNVVVLKDVLRQSLVNRYTDLPPAALDDPDEYRQVGAFVLPAKAQWENIRKNTQADDLKVRLDNVLEGEVLKTETGEKLACILCFDSF